MARDVSRLQEQERTLPGIERRPSFLPAAELVVPTKESSFLAKSRQSTPIRQSRSEVEERVQPQSPEGASLWQPDMWGLHSLSVDSREAEESSRCETRKPAPRIPIRVNRSTSKKKAQIECSIRATSWDRNPITKGTFLGRLDRSRRE